MSAGVKAQIRGLEETRAKMQQTAKDIHGGEMYDAMMEAAKTVSRDAKLIAPSDTGHLRASITPEVNVYGKEIEGVVGSNLLYSAPMETGTGTPAGHAPHYPPPDALEVWARRHGFKSGWQVARIIWRRGGLKPRNYLQKAFDANVKRIKKLLDDAAGRAVNK